MASRSKQTAAQRALLLPEILSLILMWISEDDMDFLTDPDDDKYGDDEHEEVGTSSMASDDGARLEMERLGLGKYGFGRDGVLLRCSLVNRLWNAVATPLLWEHIEFWTWGTSMPGVFGNIDPQRRQYYANLVKGPTTFTTVGQEEAASADAALQGISFSNLRSTTLQVNPLASGYHIPRIHAPGLVELCIDPPFDVNPDSYYLRGSEWDGILDQIAVCYGMLPIRCRVSVNSCGRTSSPTLRRYTLWTGP